MHEKRDEASEIGRNHSDTLYLCNFRVSVDGDWLCLKEVEDQELASEASSLEPKSSEVRQRKPPDSLAITPELERLEKIYPNYPVGNARGTGCLISKFKISKSQNNDIKSKIFFHVCRYFKQYKKGYVSIAIHT